MRHARNDVPYKTTVTILYFTFLLGYRHLDNKSCVWQDVCEWESHLCNICAVVNSRLADTQYAFCLTEYVSIMSQVGRVKTSLSACLMSIVQWLDIDYSKVGGGTSVLMLSLSPTPPPPPPPPRVWLTFITTMIQCGTHRSLSKIHCGS